MQTFLPYSSFTKSARSLDQSRLGKQRVETLQILNQLMGHRITNPQASRDEWELGPVGRGWGNHPMTAMWRGNELSLLKYGLTVCRVWTAEGRADTCYQKMMLVCGRPPMSEINAAEPPEWLGAWDVHFSHQANLVDKGKQYYLHHADKPHRPHGSGARSCDGRTRHTPHKACDPKLMWRHYRSQFPNVPVSKGLDPVAVPYVWPRS